MLRDLRLFKARVYRFQESLLDHILAECLEVKYFQGKTLNSFTQEEIAQFLTAVREGKERKLKRQEIAAIEKIDLNDELNKRLSFEKQQKLLQEPEKVVYIIGSPRSGTSYLYNLLAYQGCFSYFSDISHYQWSLFNYLNRTRLLYHEADVAILSKDSKSLKVQSEFIIPSECEDIFQRAIQVYDHVKGHEYILKRPAIKTDLDLLKLNIKKHLKIFDKVNFLSKSPFNSFRIQQLIDAYPSSYFIHIYRNGYDVSHSIRENCFHYYHPTLPSHTPEEYWSMHIKEILEHSPKDKSFLLSYEELCSHPRSLLAALFEWLQIKQEDVFLANHPYTSLTKKKEQIEFNPQIEAYHFRLKLITYDSYLQETSMTDNMTDKSIILGISCFNHDASACLIKDDRIIGFAEEERFNYEKHTAKFPSKAIEYCLKKANIEAENVTDIAFYFNPKKCIKNYFIKNNPLAALYNFSIFQRKRFWYEGIWLLQFLNQTLSIHKLLKNKTAKVHMINHHDSHTVYGLFAAPFQEGIILSNDSIGEETSTLAISFDSSKTNRILLRQKDPHSIGYLYGAVTEFLGYRRGDGEGKIMALASYGSSEDIDFFNQHVAFGKNGHFRIHRSLLLERSFQPKGQRLGKKFLCRFGSNKPEKGTFEKTHFNLAFALQKTTENILMHQVSFLTSHSNSIVLTGGVAQNSVANGLLVNHFSKTQFFVPPIPHDAGCSIGAALKVHWNLHRRYPQKIETAFLGPSYEDNEITQLLKQNKVAYRVEKEIIPFLTSKLSSGTVIAIFRKEMEGGPRALCHRSIIADPSFPGIKEYLNDHVKLREWYRPYGGFIRTSDLNELFHYYNHNEFIGRYMSFVFPVKEKWRKKISSLVHVDGTCRVQSIDLQGDPLLISLLKAYKEKKGIPILINTSFNVRGLPICRSPSDALSAFYSSGLDCLVFNDKIVIEK